MKIFVSVVAFAAFVLPKSCLGSELDEDKKFEKKEPFTPKECLNVVKKVEKSGKYTEESIEPACKEELAHSQCDFFAEALSLASSHSDFKGEVFCMNMDRAQFCSEIMDKLLESTAVSDLAFGECERAKPQKDITYCRKIQQMLALSVKEEDLDTLRACYMMEAYTNQTNPKAFEATEASPKLRIVSGSNKELDGMGKGGGPGHATSTTTTTTTTLNTVGRPDIVVQPEPLENFGKGKGKVVDPKKVEAKPAAAPAPAAAAPAAPAPAPVGPIIVQPIPADGAGKKSVSAKPGLLVVEPSRLVLAGQPSATQPVAPQTQQVTVVSVQPAQQQLLPATAAVMQAVVLQPVAKTVTNPPLATQAAIQPQPKQVVAAPSVQAVPLPKVAPPRAPSVAKKPVATKQPATEKAVSKHPRAGLAQQGLKRTKLAPQTINKEKSDYAGFLSKFVA